MKLTSLSLHNVRQHLRTELQFTDGLTGIIGPNGSGKSTILEAIAWAIYGMPAVRGTRDSVRSHGALPRAAVKVELGFELGRHSFRVVRGLTTAELYLDGGSEPIANGLNAVTETLRRRLGMSRDEFFNTYFTGQKELSVMAAMGPTERAQFLSRVLGYERLRGAQEILRKERSVTGGQLSALVAAIPNEIETRRALQVARERVAVAERKMQAAELERKKAAHRLAVAAPEWQSAQLAREGSSALSAELRLAASELASASRDVDRLEKELSSWDSARSRLAAIDPELKISAAVEKECIALELLARDAGRRQAIESQRASLASDEQKLLARLAELSAGAAEERAQQAALREARAALAEAEGALDNGRSEWTRDLQEAETRLEALRAQYTEIKTQMDQLSAAGPEGTCPTCTRPLGDHYAAVMTMLAEQRETISVDGKYFKERVEQLRRAPDEIVVLDEKRRELASTIAQRERAVAAAQLATAEHLRLSEELRARREHLASLDLELASLPSGYDAARHERLSAQLNSLAPLRREAEKLRIQIERGDPLRRELDEARSARAAAAERERSLHAASRESVHSEEAFDRVKREFEEADDSARKADLSLVAAEGELARARESCEAAMRAERDREERQRTVDDLTRKRLLMSELDRSYSDLRSDLNAQMRPELSEIASGLLAELTDGRYSEVELDSDYNIIVHEEGVAKPVISGGEEDLANLVLRLAISRMIAERAGQPLSLLVLDEIFGSLDDARRLNVLELLRKLHDRFEQVILITHIDSVREALDRLISVRYDASTGASVVERGVLRGEAGASRSADEYSGEAAD